MTLTGKKIKENIFTKPMGCCLMGMLIPIGKEALDQITLVLSDFIHSEHLIVSNEPLSTSTATFLAKQYLLFVAYYHGDQNIAEYANWLDVPADSVLGLSADHIFKIGYCMGSFMNDDLGRDLWEVRMRSAIQA